MNKQQYLIIFLCLLNFGLFGQVNLSQNLRMYLPFNGNTLDASGNNNNAVNNGAVLSTDQFGNANSAYLFNGISSFMEVANSVGLAASNNGFTMVAKVCPLGFNNNDCQANAIFQKGNTEGGAGCYGLGFTDKGFDNNCTIVSNTKNNFYALVQNNFASITIGTTAGLVGAAPYLVPNNWYCVAATWDGDSMRLYVNGVLHSKWANGINIGANTANLLIGKTLIPNNTNWLHGKLDELRIYDRAINAQEVQILCDVCKENNSFTELILNNDTSICAAVPIQINTNLLQGVDSFYWTPTIGLSNSLSANPIAIANSNTTYNLRKTVKGCNIVYNGSFEAGNTGFITNYQYTFPVNNGNTMLNEFTVASNPNPWNFMAANCADHTSGNGNMLIVNAGIDTSKIVWQQTVSVEPNKTYWFCAWASQWFNFSKSKLLFTINDIPLDTNYTIPTTNCVWNNFEKIWKSNTSNTATIKIINKSLASNNNQFLLDDIYLGPIDTVQDNYSISILPTPTASAGPDIFLCPGDSVTNIIGNVANATSFLWQPTTGLTNATNILPTATVNASVTTYSIVATNSIGCSSVDAVQIYLKPTPVGSAGGNKVFCSNTNGVQLTASGNGTALWQPTTFLSNASIFNPIANPPSNTKYTITITDSFGCILKDSITVTLQSAPNITSNAGGVVCNGDSILLIAAGGNNYTWQPVNSIITNGNNYFAKPFTNTIYTVTGKDNTYCTNTATVIIALHPNPIFTIIGDSISCNQQEINLQASIVPNNNTAFIWTPSNIITSQVGRTIKAIPATNTIFTVQTLDANNCKVSATKSVITDAIDNITVTKSNDLTCLQITAQLQASGAKNYSWAPTTGLNNASISNPIATPKATTVYTVTGSNTYCSATNIISVLVKNSIANNVLIPNVFSPNNDGINDKFELKSNGKFITYDLKIVDRWGNLCFYSKDITVSWDGTYKNREATPGTYFYKLSVLTECGLQNYNGDFILIQ